MIRTQLQRDADTFAGLPIRLQAVSSGAGAQVAAFCVLTQEVAGLRGQGALVHI